MVAECLPPSYTPVQFLVLAVCVVTLIVKRYKESVDIGRSNNDFRLDCLKQLLGAVWAYCFAFICIAADPPGCDWYFTSTVVNASFGLLIQYFLLGCLTYIIEDLTGNTTDFKTGDYRDASSGGFIIERYILQLLLWFVCVAASRSLIAFLMGDFGPVCVSVADVLLGVFALQSAWLQNAVATVFTPCFASALQVWLVDSFIRKGGLPFDDAKRWVCGRKAAEKQTATREPLLAAPLSTVARSTEAPPTSGKDGAKQSLAPSAKKSSRRAAPASSPDTPPVEKAALEAAVGASPSPEPLGSNDIEAQNSPVDALTLKTNGKSKDRSSSKGSSSSKQRHSPEAVEDTRGSPSPAMTMSPPLSSASLSAQKLVQRGERISPQEVSPDSTDSRGRSPGRSRIAVLPSHRSAMTLDRRIAEMQQKMQQIRESDGASTRSGRSFIP